MEITREQVLRFRVHAQQLDREQVAEVSTAARVLDLGVQDSGPDGARWALELRGFAPEPAGLITAWTLRGAPHVYRRRQAAEVAAAVGPVSESDAAKRIFDASRPLKEAGIPVLDALDRVAAEMRSVVSRPTVKGELSRALNDRLPAPYQRNCRPPGAVHGHEILGSWRPRMSGTKLRLAVDPWAPLPDLTAQAERLAAFRGVRFDGFVDA